MYILFNYLFGWDYVYWKNTCDSGISRVHVTADGTPYYYRYRATNIIDLADGTVSKILWLTCPRSKYYKED